MRPTAETRPIALRLVVYALIVGVLLTVVGTAVQLYLEYDRTTQQLQSRLREIRHGHLGPLSASLWESDDELITTELEGILAIPSVELVELRQSDGAVRAVGQVTSERTIDRFFSITHSYRGQDVPLGELRVTAGLDGLIEAVLGRMAMVLASQAVMVFIVSALIFVIVHFTVTRHLSAMAAHARHLRPGRFDEPLRLEGRPIADRAPDEIDELAHAYNTMRENLARSYAELSRHQEDLEREVGQRTGELETANATLREEVRSRTMAQDALRASEAQLRVLIGHLPGAVWTVDGELRFTSVAGARAAELGLDPGRVMGARLGDVAPWGPAATAVVEAHDRALGGTRGELEIEHGGRTYEVAVESLEAGIMGDVIGVALDVTERRRLEAERLRTRLQEAQKLESLGILAGGIAHDFNNLLVGILGNASLAKLQLAQGTKARALVERVEVTAQRAAELTHQMLAYSGKGHFVIEPMDIGTIAEEMARLLEASISKKVTLRFDFAPELPPIDADVAQIRQLVMNLITNASDAIGDRSGTITLSTGLVEADRAYLDGTHSVDELPEGRYVALEVSDSGVGMSAETQRRMFDPFFTTKTTGHGLGLAACLGIVRGHRGCLKVYSEPGRGTCIKVLFPTSEAAVAPVGVRSPRTEDAPVGGTVLVVDDDATVRLFAKEALAFAGFQVLMASDGVEGVEIYRDHADQIDVVLLDMTMPRLDGEETFRELRRIRPDVAVVLSSGYNEQDATHRFAGKGLAGFLQKPYRTAQVIERVREVLARG